MPHDLYDSIALHRENLNEQIANQLQQMIVARTLRTGDRLPSERDLSQTLNVNRATVREAIQILAQRGLVEMRPGSGAYVIEMQAAVVGQAIERYYVSKQCSQRDLQAVRELLEPEIAAQAALHATPPDLARVEETLQRLEQAYAVKPNTEYVATDAEFHLTLAIASHNELFVAITSGLSGVLQKWIYATYQYRPNPASHRMHRLVFQAVAAGDAARARAVMYDHMRSIPILE